MGEMHMTKILIALENIGLGGLKRATTVVGNALVENHEVSYYSFSDLEPFYNLEAPLIFGKTPVTLDNGVKPFERFATQISEFNQVASDFDVVFVRWSIVKFCGTFNVTSYTAHWLDYNNVVLI